MRPCALGRVPFVEPEPGRQPRLVCRPFDFAELASKQMLDVRYQMLDIMTADDSLSDDR